MSSIALSLVRGSTNYLRALLLFENGVPVQGATVTATISKTYGDPLPGLENAVLLPVSDTVTYNYQLTIQPNQIDVDEGLFYEVEVLAVFGPSSIRKRAIVQVSQ